MDLWLSEWIDNTYFIYLYFFKISYVDIVPQKLIK